MTLRLKGTRLAEFSHQAATKAATFSQKWKKSARY